MEQLKNLKFEFPEIDTDGRLGELIIYIADKCQNDPYFGATKLNKILWLSDMMSYAYYGEPITGTAYQRLNKGPASKRLLPVKDKLIRNSRIVERQSPFGLHTQKRIIAISDPDLKIFTARDISLVDTAIDFLRGKTATTSSEMSHIKPWKIAKPKELIPYQAIFLSGEEITDYDISRTKELSEQFGWPK